MSEEGGGLAAPAGSLRCPICSRLLAEIDGDGAVIVLNNGRSRLVVRDADIECLRCLVVVSVHTEGRLHVGVKAGAATWGASGRRRR